MKISKINNITTDTFFPWFLGFMDAEGNFQTTFEKIKDTKGIYKYYKVKYSIHISLQIRDRMLLDYIKTKLDNRGIIYDYPLRQESHYAILKIEDIKWLINNIFSKYPLLTMHQSNRYERLRYGITNNINKIQLLPISEENILNKNIDIGNIEKSNVDLDQLFIENQIIDYNRNEEKNFYINN